MLTELLNLFFPKLCAGCDAILLDHEDQICLQCETSLPFATYRNPNDNQVSRIFHGRIDLSGGHYLLNFHKSGIAQKLLHQLKYKGNEQLGSFLGELLAHRMSTPLPDLLIPVPITPDKLKVRGYNQSLCIAKGLSKVLNVPIADDLIIRKGQSKSQTKLDRSSRWENVKGEFLLHKNDYVARHVWIVDDTITTGATVESCAKCLPKNIKIGVAVIAYAD